LSPDERYYYNQIKQLETMGFERALTLPYLIKYDGNVDRVINVLV
jgi:hypothetical protein